MMWSGLDWYVQAKRDGSARCIPWDWRVTIMKATFLSWSKVKYWCGRYALQVQAQIIPTPIQRATRELSISWYAPGADRFKRWLGDVFKSRSTI